MKKIIITLLIATLLGAVGIGGYWYVQQDADSDPFAVVRAYSAYDSESVARYQAAVRPGLGESSTRQELNTTLSKVLTADISDEQRLQLSTDGLELIAQMRERIREIDENRLAVDDAITELENSATGIDMASSQKLVEAARKRYETINRIRVLSDAIADDVESVFMRVIENEGALTSEHIKELNALIPEAERRFEERVQLYRELKTLDEEIDTAYQQFTSAVSE